MKTYQGGGGCLYIHVCNIATFVFLFCRANSESETQSKETLGALLQNHIICAMAGKVNDPDCPIKFPEC